MVLLSDHGLGYGKSYYGQSAKAKEDYFNPTFMVILPESFARARPAVDRALRENTARVTGHFDAYETVRALLLGQETESKSKQGASLLSPLKKGRTCDEIGVPVQACPCVRWKRIAPLDGAAARTVGGAIAGRLARKLNDALATHAGPSSGLSPGLSCLKWLPGSGNASNVALKAGRFSERVVIATVVLHTPKFGTLGDQEFSVKLEMKKKKKKEKKTGSTLGGAVEDVGKAIARGAMEISHWYQASKWGKYEKCAPKGVPLNVCACV